MAWIYEGERYDDTLAGRRELCEAIVNKEKPIGMYVAWAVRQLDVYEGWFSHSFGLEAALVDNMYGDSTGMDFQSLIQEGCDCLFGGLYLEWINVLADEEYYKDFAQEVKE